MCYFRFLSDNLIRIKFSYRMENVPLSGIFHCKNHDAPFNYHM